MSDNRNYFANIIAAIFIIAFLYCAVSFTAYRFRHPEQTETQLWINTLDAIAWK